MEARSALHPANRWRHPFLLAWIILLTAGCAGSPYPEADLAWQRLDRGLRPHAYVLALSFDRFVPGRMWAGVNSNSALYVSLDGGDSWGAAGAEPSPGTEPWTPPAFAVLQSVRSAGVILVATGDGLRRSEDGGTTWRRVGPPSLAVPVYTLAQDATGAIFLGGEGRTLLRSDDAGLTWQALPAWPGGEAVLSLAVSASGGWLLAGTDGSGLFSSRDGGRTWERVEVAGEAYVASIVLAPGGAPPCAGVGECALVRTRSGLVRTWDGGATWEKVAAGWEGRADAVAIAGEEPAWLLLTDRGRVYRSPDGAGWEPLGEGLGRTGAVFTAVADPTRPQTVLAGTENGLYRSDDGGRNWHPAPSGPGTPAVHALVADRNGVLYAGTVDGVFASTNGGESWERRSAGLPLAPVVALAAAPSLPGLLYAGMVGEGLFRSADGGASWTATAWRGATVSSVAVDGQDPDRVYIRVAFERVYASEDGGQSFGARWEGLALNTELISLTVDPHDPGCLFAGGNDRLYRSTDRAASWQPVGPELNGQTVFALVVDARDRERLYAGATKGAYESADGGLSWRPWGRGLEEITVTTLAFHPHNDDLVYAGTKYRGLYRSTDGGRRWRPANKGLGDVSIDALLVSEDGRWLYAATSQGLFRGRAR